MFPVTRAALTVPVAWNASVANTNAAQIKWDCIFMRRVLIFLWEVPMTSPSASVVRLAIEVAISPRQAQHWTHDHLKMCVTERGYLPVRHALVVMKALVDLGFLPEAAGTHVRNQPPDGSGVWIKADPVLILSVRY